MTFTDILDIIEEGVASGRITFGIEKILASEIYTDPRVNPKKIDQMWVKKTAPHFTWLAIGLPHVSRQADDALKSLDGQNRNALIKHVGQDHVPYEARVFYGLLLTEEASIARKLNENRQWRTVYKFLNRIIEKEPVATAINNMVTAAGWEIGKVASSQKISSTASLERLYELTPEAPGRAIPTTLHVATSAWGHAAESVNGNVLLGIGMVIARHGTLVDIKSLTKKLAALPGGATGLLGQGRSRVSVRGAKLPAGIAEATVDIYNKGRRGGKGLLPDWR